MAHILAYENFTKLYEWKNQQSILEADSQNTAELDEIKEDIERSIALLMGRYPFFGAFIYKFRILYVPSDDPDVRTMATDGVNIYINPAFAKKLTDKETVFVLCHEILHNVMLHFIREKNKGVKNHDKWNRAADYEINPMLVEEGLLTKDELVSKLKGLYNDKYLDMPAEEIYDLIGNEPMPKPPQQPPMPKDDKDKDKSSSNSGSGDENGEGEGESGKGKGQSNGEGDGEGDGEGEGSGGGASSQGGGEGEGDGIGGIMDDNASVRKQKELGVPIKTATEESADKLIKEAMGEIRHLNGGAGRGVGGGMIQRAIDRLKKPQVDWKSALRRIVGKITGGTEEYFGKKKALYRGDYIYGDRDADSDRLKDAIVAVDTSGSIGDNELSTFLSEIAGIIKAKQIKKTEIIYFDDGIKGRDWVKSPPKFNTAAMKGGGGTSFIDPMEAIYDKWKKGRMELAVFLTDGYGDQNGAEFQAQIKKWKKMSRTFIWLIIDNPSFNQPFGEKVLHISTRKK
jgi:predicted metal-dependent peptidase